MRGFADEPNYPAVQKIAEHGILAIPALLGMLRHCSDTLLVQAAAAIAVQPVPRWESRLVPLALLASGSSPKIQELALADAPAIADPATWLAWGEYWGYLLPSAWRGTLRWHYRRGEDAGGLLPDLIGCQVATVLFQAGYDLESASYLGSIATEALFNVRTHGGGQGDVILEVASEEQRLTVRDAGEGIRAYPRVGPTIDSDAAAIRWALVEGNTTPGRLGGMGFPAILFDVASLSPARLIITSGRGEVTLTYPESTVQSRDLSTSVAGTWLSVTLALVPNR